MSEYSQSLRRRLGNIADFKNDFDIAFEGFVENNLPRDELWKQIEEEMEENYDGEGEENSGGRGSYWRGQAVNRDS